MGTSLDQMLRDWLLESLERNGVEFEAEYYSGICCGRRVRLNGAGSLDIAVQVAGFDRWANSQVVSFFPDRKRFDRQWARAWNEAISTDAADPAMEGRSGRKRPPRMRRAA